MRERQSNEKSVPIRPARPYLILKIILSSLFVGVVGNDDSIHAMHNYVVLLLKLTHTTMCVLKYKKLMKINTPIFYKNQHTF